MLRNQKGITLVALVVTIVVLIILATISISVAMNGDLIGRAETAGDWHANAEAEFDQLAANTVDYVDAYIANAEATGSSASN